MSAGMSRQEFLRGWMRRRAPLRPAPEAAGGPSEAFAADFPAAALRDEAIRLGLDPDALPAAALLAAIHDHMRRQRAGDAAATPIDANR